MSIATRPLTLFVAVVSLLAASEAAADTARRGPPKARTTVELTGVINLNTATEAQLGLLPGVGASKARAIVALRSKKKFTSTDQVMKVKGIGKKTYRKLKPHLAVSGQTTLVRSKKPARAAMAPAHEVSRAPVRAARRAP